MALGPCLSFGNKKIKYIAYDHFHGNGMYGENPTKKEPIRMLRCPSRLPCQIII